MHSIHLLDFHIRIINLRLSDGWLVVFPTSSIFHHFTAINNNLIVDVFGNAQKTAAIARCLSRANPNANGAFGFYSIFLQSLLPTRTFFASHLICRYACINDISGF